MQYQNNYLWENNHLNVQFRASRMYPAWPLPVSGAGSFSSAWQAGTACLKSILKDAEASGKSVRATGGGWSLSEVTVTNDYLVDSQPLKMLRMGLQAADVATGVDPAMVFLAQCGTNVKYINSELAKIGMALPTSGASDGQTIAGAISTGTHGAAINVGAMQDNVRGLHIVTASNEDVWIEPAQQVISDAFFKATFPGARRINDDAVFHAAIVSFGSFGLIHGVMLGCVPLYLLAIHQQTLDWSVVKTCLNGPGNFAALGLPPDPHHFEVVVNPYRLDKVITMTMYKQPATTPPTLVVPPGAPGPGSDVLTLISSISNAIPAAIPDAMKFIDKQINASYPDRHGETEYPGFIFSSNLGPSLTGAGLSTELGIDAAHTAQVADIITDVALHTESLVGVVSFRFVKGSKATLAFTRFPVSCAIEFPSVLSNQTLKFFNALWNRLEAEGITFTFHWGQCNNLNAARVMQKWGAPAVQSWIAARHQVLRTPQQRAMFANAFLHQCGLADDAGSVPPAIV